MNRTYIPDVRVGLVLEEKESAIIWLSQSTKSEIFGKLKESMLNFQVDNFVVFI